jgi:serine protease Do
MLLIGALLPCPAPAADDASPAARLQRAIEETQARIVKIYGAGGFRGLEAYQSGMLVSPEGHILTAWSYVLDTDYITAVLDDGRKLEAKLVGADPRLEVAVLKVEGENLPFFDLAKAVSAEPGDRVLALSNAFGVAQGNERASVQQGVISVNSNLSARRGVFETPYRGRVYVVDAVTNNPGAAGGVLVSRRGELLGMLGKELKNSLNNTWLNYAVPIDELRASVDEIRAGRFVARTAEEGEKKPERAHQLANLGLLLVPDVLERTPPFVDGVAPQSPAMQAGLQPDDLIVLLGDRLIQSCKNLAGELEYIDHEDSITLTIIRGSELLELTIKPPANGTP